MQIDKHYRIGLGMILTGIAYIIGHTVVILNKQEPQRTESQPPASLSLQTPTSPPAPKYSGTQVIRRSNEPGRSQDILTLDGAGELQESTGDLVSIDLVLPKRPTLRVDKPTAGKRYPLGDPDLNFRVQGKGIEASEFRYIPPGSPKFTFSRAGVSSHLVTVGTRTFRVKLKEIRDKSEGKLWMIEYTFDIAEE